MIRGEATPTIEDLKKTARGLLAEIANRHSQWVATGGFRVDIYKDPVELTLSFVAVEDSVYV